MSLRRFALGVIASAPLLGGCTADQVNSLAPRPRAITFGTRDLENTYSNVGAFLVESPTGQIYPICSGTLIAATVFLTAAHCTLYFTGTLAPLGYTAFVSFSNPILWGPKTDVGSTELIPVTQVVTNSTYSQRQSDAGDIAVLLLAPGYTSGITPAVLPTLGLLDQLQAAGDLKDAVFTAVGYGVQERVVGGGVPFFRDENPIYRRYAFSSFNALSPGYLRLSENPATGNGGTCYGDSGGPNVLDVNGEKILVAITITGDAVCRSTNVDYRLDIPTAQAFLSQFVTLP